MPEPSARPLIAAYTDETQYNVGRYRGLALVSVRQEQAQSLGEDVRRLLQASGVAECKWEKVRSAKTHFAAGKLLDWTIQQAEQGTLRLDTLTWDTDDRLRPGQGVPHIRNLRKMYRALLERVLPECWGMQAAWQLYPDEQNAMPWEQLIVGLPQVAGICVSHSHEQPLIQLADLFAGLAVYSRDSYDLYEQWLCDVPPRRDRQPDAHNEAAQYSASDRVRCLLLDYFFTACKFRGLGVDLRTRRGLYTADATRPLAFHWWQA